jgi:hypothetical protein
MYDKHLSEVEKIERFRKMILYIQQTEKPEIIIIGIPGGLLPINDKLHNEYGLIHLETCLACRADLLLLSLYYDDYINSSVEFWANYARGRFNTQLAGIVISKTWMDLGITMEINELYTCLLERKPPAIINNPDESGVFFSLFDPALGEKLSGCILDEFQQSCIK